MFLRFNLSSFFCLVFAFCFAQNSSVYYTDRGDVYFASENSLETITAKSNELKGLLNLQNGNFAFVIRVTSFEGFNISLQKEHFNENYLESSKFPNASFSGRLIDDLTFSKSGNALVRVKGILKIHGIEQEKIFKVYVSKKGNTLSTLCSFSIFLSDFEIKVPRIVHGKISPEISIEVKADLLQKQNE